MMIDSGYCFCGAAVSALSALTAATEPLFPLHKDTIGSVLNPFSAASVASDNGSVFVAPYAVDVLVKIPPNTTTYKNIRCRMCHEYTKKYDSAGRLFRVGYV